MNIVAIVTTITPEFIDLVVHEHGQHTVTVVSPYTEVIQTFSSVGISGYLLKQRKIDVSAKDKMFAEAMMPGNMVEYGSINDSDLPFWQVISLDRLKFWFDHSGKTNMDFINGLSADKAYASLDINSPYVLGLRNNKIHRVGVQTGPIRTPDFYFAAGVMDFDEYIVLEEEDEQFLTKTLKKKNVKSLGKSPRNGKRTIEYQERKRIKKQIGLAGKVVGVIFDKRDEWQTRKFLSEQKGDATILVFAPDKRSKELAPTVLYQYRVIFHTEVLPMFACDSIVAFRWDEMHYMGTVPSTLEIIDYNGMNLAKKLAPEWVKVSE